MAGLYPLIHERVKHFGDHLSFKRRFLWQIISNMENILYLCSLFLKELTKS